MKGAVRMQYILGNTVKVQLGSSCTSMSILDLAGRTNITDAHISVYTSCERWLQPDRKHRLDSNQKDHAFLALFHYCYRLLQCAFPSCEDCFFGFNVQKGRKKLQPSKVLDS